MDYRLLRNLDISLIVTTTLIMLIGFTILASATLQISNDAFFFVKKQLIGLLLGLAIMVLVMSIDYTKLLDYSKYLYVFNLIMLASVLVLGRTAKGAQSWISLGALNIQPSEFAKVILIITLAAYLTRNHQRLRTITGLFGAFIHVGIPMLLILLQPDLGTSLTFLSIMFGMLFVAGANPWVLGGIIVSGLSSAVLWIYLHLNHGVYLPLKEYQLNRLIVFLDPNIDPAGSGWNIIQSKIAIGSGGFFGKGFLDGTQGQLNFLPEHHTDFIFAVLGEEFGFLGGASLILLFFFFLYRLIAIAVESKDMFGSLMVTGIASMILFHVFENIGMSIGIMPITGVPLPFVSYGGTFMLMNMIALGLVLNVNIRKHVINF